MFFIALSNIGYCQNNKIVNLIITINDKVVEGAIAHMQLHYSDKAADVLDVNYYPGRLIARAYEYQSIPDSVMVYLTFDYYDNSNKHKNLTNFRIPLQKRWLESEYFILKIFDLNDKKYKGVFDPLSKDQNYTFSISSPDYTFGRITRRK